MPRFAANLSTLFVEFEFLDRFEVAAEAGFKAVEIQFPYDYDKDRITEALAANNLELVLHNLPSGNLEAGELGLTCLPGRRNAYRDSVETAINFAGALGCPRLNSLIGVPGQDVDLDAVEQTLIANLRHAAAALKKAGLTLLIEPVNDRDNPGYLLNRSAAALAVIEAVGADNLYLQFDCYHMQIMEGDLARSLRVNAGRIGHIQIADNPGRHEPGTGEINYPFLFSHLDDIGYSGWVGVEYHPLTTTLEGLGWIKPYL